MARQQMIPSDDKKGYAKTSLIMTRSMSDDIGLMVKKILEDIDNDKVNLTYAQWQEFVSYVWNNEISQMAINKAIRKAKEIDLNLNTCKEFLELIAENTPSELKKEFAKTHPIARLSLMLIPTKKPPEPEKKRKYEDLWKSAEELRKEKQGK